MTRRPIWQQKANQRCLDLEPPGEMLFFFFFFNVDHFKSLHWICYNIIPVFFFWFLDPRHVGILAPWAGIEPAPPALKGEVLTLGPPWKSQDVSLENRSGDSSFLPWLRNSGASSHTEAPSPPQGRFTSTSFYEDMEAASLWLDWGEVNFRDSRELSACPWESYQL